MQIALGGGCVSRLVMRLEMTIFFGCVHIRFCPIVPRSKLEGFETYKTTFGMRTKALGWIDDIHIKVGIIVYNMIFFVVDTNELQPCLVFQ